MSSPAQTPARLRRPLLALLGVSFGAVVVAIVAVFVVARPSRATEVAEVSALLAPIAAEDGSQARLGEAGDVIRSRLAAAGAVDVSVSTDSSGQLRVTAAAVERAVFDPLVSTVGQLDFRPVLALGSGVPPPEVTPTATTAMNLPRGALDVPPAVQAAYDLLDCADAASLAPASPAQPGDYLAACDGDGTVKYLLAPALLDNGDVGQASSGLPSGGIGTWQVNLVFTAAGTEKFADATATLAAQPAPTNAFAIVLDGIVLSAPTVLEEITSGAAQITGSFGEEEAAALAVALDDGALPFPVQLVDESVTTGSSSTLRDNGRFGLVRSLGVLAFLLAVLWLLVFRMDGRGRRAAP